MSSYHTVEDKFMYYGFSYDTSRGAGRKFYLPRKGPYGASDVFTSTADFILKTPKLQKVTKFIFGKKQKESLNCGCCYCVHQKSLLSVKAVLMFTESTDTIIENPEAS